MVDRSSLPILHRGDQITADHYAAITEFAKNPPWANAANFGGYADASGTSFFKNQEPNYRVQIDPTQNFSRNSVMLLGGAATGAVSGPVASQGWPTSIWKGLRQHKGNTTPNYATTNMHRLFATNESDDLVTGTQGWATLIRDKPIKVLADPYFPPLPFWPCGPEQGKASVSCRSAGLMAVSAVDDFGLVEVVAHTPRFFFAKSTGALSKPSTMLVSATTCTVDILFPKFGSTNELEASQDAAFLGLTVSNHDPTLEVPADTYGHVTFEWGTWWFVWTAC